MNSAGRELRRLNDRLFPGMTLVGHDGTSQPELPVGNRNQVRPELGVVHRGTGKARPQQMVLDEAIPMFDSVTTKVEAPIVTEVQWRGAGIHQPQRFVVGRLRPALGQADLNDTDFVVTSRFEVEVMPDRERDDSQVVVGNHCLLVRVKPGVRLSQIQNRAIQRRSAKSRAMYGTTIQRPIGTQAGQRVDVQVGGLIEPQRAGIQAISQNQCR